MEEIGHSHAYGVDVGIGEQFFVVGVHVGNVELLRQLDAAVGVEARDRDHLGARLGREALEMPLGDSAADDANPKHLLIHARAVNLSWQATLQGMLVRRAA